MYYLLDIKRRRILTQSEYLEDVRQFAIENSKQKGVENLQISLALLNAIIVKQIEV